MKEQQKMASSLIYVFKNIFFFIQQLYLSSNHKWLDYKVLMPFL